MYSYRSGCQIEEVQGEWQKLKALVRHTFSEKCYSSLWQTLITKKPYCDDYKVISSIFVTVYLPVVVLVVLSIAYGHIKRSQFGLSQLCLEGIVKGKRSRGRQHKRWRDNTYEWSGLDLGH